MRPRSSDNLELVRSICTAWDRGDYSSAGWAHPEIELVVADGPSPGRWRGITGMAEVWREWLGAWEKLRQEADEYRELDDERVLVFFRMRGRGKTSGLDLAQMHPLGAGLFHVRDARVTKCVAYADHERAVADVGPAPEARRLIAHEGSVRQRATRPLSDSRAAPNSVSARRGSARVAPGFLVERLGREIDAVGPSDRAGLGVDSHAREVLGIGEGLQHPAPFPTREFHLANGSVIERQAQAMVADNFDLGNIM